MDTDLTLFPDADPVPRCSPAGPFAAVAIERSLDRVLDYAIPPAFVHCLRVGQRVKVPLGRGNKPVHGYVVSIHTAATTSAKIKPLRTIEDDRVLLTESLLQLIRWMSRYYCCPLGMVIESVIPASVKKKTGLTYTRMVRLTQPHENIQAMLDKTRAPKRRAILARLLEIPADAAIELTRLASQAGATVPTVRKLVKAGLIAITQKPDYGPDSPAGTVSVAETHPVLTLNEDQRRACDDLAARIPAGFSVNLLHGVTGSGKTEVYLRCIEQVVRSGRQAIVLVPEIALTPQTVARFAAWFPRVAVLHSGETASRRHRFWQQALQGQADVVVGTRSAIFAPFPNLGIIIVDEEHESTYKSWDKSPYYHARDIAVKRAQIEGIPVILGSATPSLESYYRATQTSPAAYHLLSLPRRVRNLELPKVELVDMKYEAKMHRPAVHLISQRLSHLLRTTVNDRQQAILLLNRRGYSSFVHCSSCGHVVQCKYCDCTMTYHRSADVHATGAKFDEARKTGQLHCHYCLAVNTLPVACPECGKKLSLIGMGTQRVEEELARRFPDIAFARVDTDTMRSAEDYRDVFDRFRRGEVQVLLGTQMIAKGLDYPNVTLVGVISADTALGLPDFRAAERTFQLITQVAGRAGRGDISGRVVLQTFMPDDPTIQSAIKQDYEGFAAREIQARREVGLPPATRMVRIHLRDQDIEKLQDRAQKLHDLLNAAIASDSQLSAGKPPIVIKGPMPCAVNRIAGYHRFQILLLCPSAAALQRILYAARQRKAFADSEKTAVDVDPISLL